MKKLLAKLVLAGAFAFQAAAANAQEVTLRFAFGTQMDGPGGKAVQAMVDKLEELTNGEVAVEVFPNAQLGGEVEMLAQLRSGNIELALLGTGVVSTAIAPNLQVTILPFIWESREKFWSTIRGPFGDKLLEQFDAAGLKGLAWGTWGERGFITNGFAINGPEDIKGKKMRVTQSQVFMETMGKLGGNPVPLPYPEVYTALQQNAVDGVETSNWAMVEAKFYEVATSMAVTDHFVDTATIIMNKQAFDGLKPEYQEAIVEAARVGGQVMFEEISKSTDSAVDVMKEAGLEITYPDKAPFREAVKPVYDLFAEQIGQDIIDEIRAAQQ